MRGLFAVASLLRLTLAEEGNTTQVTEPIGTPIYEKLGDLPKLTALDRLEVGGPIAGRVFNPAYAELRTKANCVFPLDIVLIQDATASFADDYEQMKNEQLSLLVDGISSVHPNSRIGLMSFRDKPVWSLGDGTDYCFREDVPLQEANFTALYNGYVKLNSIGGADPAENQLGAITAALQSPTIGWTTSATAVATKLVVVITDAWFHYQDDGLNAYGMTPFTGQIDFAHAAEQCVAQYYPTVDQARDLIHQSKAYVGILVFDGAWANSLPIRSWTTFNRYIGQTDDFLAEANEDSSNFWVNLAGIIKTIEEAECLEDTTPAPTTEAPTTTAPPTTAAVTTTTAAVPTTPAAVVTTTAAIPTTTAALPTTTAAVPTTAALPTTTAAVPTTAPLPTVTTATVTPVGTPEAPPTTEEIPATGEGECHPCHPEGPCPSPEVEIKLRHRPDSLVLEVHNDQAGPQ